MSGHHLMHGSAEVLFVRVSADKAFSRLGALAARSGGLLDDSCEVSCVDWYGNARPIFYRDRVFALMGYELVEGALEKAGLEELCRARFFRSDPDARKGEQGLN